LLQLYMIVYSEVAVGYDNWTTSRDKNLLCFSRGPYANGFFFLTWAFTFTLHGLHLWMGLPVETAL
jgi:hypothetical protein